MTEPLTDALAAALGDLFPHYQREKWPFTAEQASAAILADPAFREALTAAVAEGLEAAGVASDMFNAESDAAAIVAQMLPEADHATD